MCIRSGYVCRVIIELSLEVQPEIETTKKITKKIETNNFFPKNNTPV